MPLNQLTKLPAIVLSVILGAVIYFGVEISPLDLWIQDLLYDFGQGKWLVDQNSFWPKLIFYQSIKIALVVLGTGSLVLFIHTFYRSRYKHNRWVYLYLFICMSIVPLTASSMKSVTNTYCPWDISRYGGDQPYVKVMETYPPDYRQTNEQPHCFPAGHASGGFALFAFFFIVRGYRRKIIALGCALGVGWTMGIYQMLKGAHYFSHTLATMILAWILCQVIYYIMAKIFIFDHPLVPFSCID
jgi:membrane-associated PAP2 superfamily phosphatase